MNAVPLPSGPGFGALIDYLTEEGRDLMAYASEPVLSLASAGMEMEALASMNSRLNDEPERALLHYTLTWPSQTKGERPDARTIIKVARGSVDALGFDETRHQVVIIVHDDTPTHIHAHVVINRVRTGDFRMHNPRNSYVKLDRFCREMEIEHGWSHSRGLHDVVDTELGPTIVRRKRGTTDYERPSNAAATAELQSGIPSLQRWIRWAPADDVRRVLDDRFAQQEDVHAALAENDLGLRRYGKGHVLCVLSDRTITPVAASKMGVGLDYARFTARFGDLEVPDGLPAAKRSYRRDVRELAPDSMRDRYEYLRATWRESEQGQLSAGRWKKLREDARRERDRLRKQRDAAQRKARKNNDTVAESLADLVYQVRRNDLEAELQTRRADLRALDRLDGRPAATFFKWVRRQQRAGDASTPPVKANELVGEFRLIDYPPEIPGFAHTLGPSGRDYLRDRTRVMILKRDRVTVLSKEPADIAAALRLAQETFGPTFAPTGNADFMTRVERLGGPTPRVRPGV